MPIRFRCPRCQQRLSIGSHKSGALIQCPTCKDQVRVPEGSEVLSVRGPSSSEPEFDLTTQSTSIAVPMAELIEPAAAPTPSISASSPSIASTQTPAPKPSVAPPSAELPIAPTPSTNSPWITSLDQSRVTVPRYVIFTQGLLLGAVGLVCLLVGVVLGWSISPTTSPIDPETMPCVVSGAIEYEDSQGARHPDIGAVILALPAAKQPESSISSDGLGPDDPQPKPDHPGLRILESIGGRIARANAAGRYELRVPRGGDFYIIAISRQARRSGEHQPKVTTIIGKYIRPATKLLGDYQYAMQEPVLREERHLDFFFKPSSSE